MTAWQRGLVAALVAGACSDDDKVLAELDGGWSGAIQTEAGPVGVAGALTFDEGAGLLAGTFQLADPGQPHTYAVRRWEVARGLVYLDLTDVADATRGLDLDGEVGDGGFTGTATVTYPCETGTCGYVGDFQLTRGEAPLTPGDTGTTPGDTGTTPGDTGTTPSDTGATPSDTGPTPSDTGAR